MPGQDSEVCESGVQHCDFRSGRRILKAVSS